MIEKGLLIALVALAVILGGSAIADAMSEGNQKLSCALEGAKICVVDGKVGQ